MLNQVNLAPVSEHNAVAQAVLDLIEKFEADKLRAAIGGKVLHRGFMRPVRKVILIEWGMPPGITEASVEIDATFDERLRRAVALRIKDTLFGREPAPWGPDGMRG